MRLLLAVTAIFEGVTALALVLLPGAVARLLLGPPLDTPGAVVARLTGCALFALAFICWSARNDAGLVADRVVAAMLFYNAAAVFLLAYARLGLGMTGIGIVPGILAHVALTVWCGVCLRASRRA
jgi:hypothetical protein